MNVKDVITELEKLDPDMTVVTLQYIDKEVEYAEVKKVERAEAEFIDAAGYSIEDDCVVL